MIPALQAKLPFAVTVAWLFAAAIPVASAAEVDAHQRLIAAYPSFLVPSSGANTVRWRDGTETVFGSPARSRLARRRLCRSLLSKRHWYAEDRYSEGPRE